MASGFMAELVRSGDSDTKTYFPYSPMFCCTRQFLVIYDYFPSRLKGSNYKPPRPQEKPSMQNRYIKPVMNAPFPCLLIQSKTG